VQHAQPAQHTIPASLTCSHGGAGLDAGTRVAVKHSAQDANARGKYVDASTPRSDRATHTQSYDIQTKVLTGESGRGDIRADACTGLWGHGLCRVQQSSVCSRQPPHQLAYAQRESELSMAATVIALGVLPGDTRHASMAELPGQGCV
jgi:hypothetical protein